MCALEQGERMAGRGQEQSQNYEEMGKEELLTEADELVKQLTKNLPLGVSRESVSTTSKTALKAYVIRASLFHRMTELTEVAVDLYRQDQLIAAFVITRSAFETAALVYHTYKHIKKVVETGKIGDIDERLMEVLFGERLPETEYKTVNILTAIDKLDKEVTGVRDMYDGLCEFAHPNWSGAMGAYVKADQDFFTLNFNQKHENIPPEVGLLALIAALSAFEHYESAMSAILPSFTKIHEEGRENAD
jgi:hypothetical protein